MAQAVGQHLVGTLVTEEPPVGEKILVGDRVWFHLADRIWLHGTDLRVTFAYLVSENKPMYQLSVNTSL